MWLTACFWASNNGTCDLRESFSEMLANDTRVQQWYLAWWGIFVMIRLVLMILVCAYKIHKGYRNSAKLRYCQCPHQVTIGVYFVFVGLYVIMTLMMLVNLPLVMYFPVTTQSQTHYLVAGLAFGSGIFSCFALFVRRCLLVLNLKQSTFPWWLLIIDGILIMTQIGMAITFLIVDNGVYEFVLAVLLVFDAFFQICDFYFDKDPLEHIGLDTTSLLKT